MKENQRKICKEILTPYPVGYFISRIDSFSKAFEIDEHFLTSFLVESPKNIEELKNSNFHHLLKHLF